MEEIKRKQDLEDEMSRFEQEIANNLPPPPKIPNTGHMPIRPPMMIPPPPFQGNNDGTGMPFPGPPPVPPVFRSSMDGMPPMDQILSMPPPHMPQGFIPPPMMVPPPMMQMVPPPGLPTGKPKGLSNRIAPPTVPLKNYDHVPADHADTYNFGGESSSGEVKKRKIKNKAVVRVAGGTVWEDSTLLEWDTNDFRIFVGDLGNEVSDDALLRAFSRYPSLMKAKVIRDKKTKKTKGFGFVSFKDPQDYLKAMREMNGKYVGNRPIKLRKSTWKDRNIQVAKKKEKEKKKLGLR